MPAGANEVKDVRTDVGKHDDCGIHDVVTILWYTDEGYRAGLDALREASGKTFYRQNKKLNRYAESIAEKLDIGVRIRVTDEVDESEMIVCPECGEHFYGPGAEELAFNSQGACKCCGGTGTVRTVDRSTLVPDESISIDDGAVAPWNSLMWSLMTDVGKGDRL